MIPPSPPINVATEHVSLLGLGAGLVLYCAALVWALIALRGTTREPPLRDRDDRDW